MGESVTPYLGNVFENIVSGKFIPSIVYKTEKLELDPEVMTPTGGFRKWVRMDRFEVLRTCFHDDVRTVL